MSQPFADPFVPYLTTTPPVILRELEAPHLEDGVLVRRLVFQSRTVETVEGPVTSEIYAVVARPEGEGPFPGLLVLHGGGGVAEHNKAVAWAKRGYIVVAPELPGIGEPTKMEHSSGAWKAYSYGEHRFVAQPDVTESVIFDGIVAGLQGFNLLTAQPKLALDKVGIIGISWGGFTTTMLCGLLGERVAAAFSLYGSGFYEHTVNNMPDGGLAKMTPEDRDAWLKYLDAGRRAGNITAKYFVAAATNDFFFFPPAVSATLEAIPGEKNQLFAPNCDHKIKVPGGTEPESSDYWVSMEVPYIEYHLKGVGEPVPTVWVLEAGSDPLSVRFEFHAPLPVKAVTVHYSPVGPAWKERVWESVPVEQESECVYRAQLPPATGGHWFASISDGRPVTVSTMMQGVA